MPVARLLHKKQSIYSTTKLEFLAIIFAIEKLRPYIEGVKFTVITIIIFYCFGLFDCRVITSILFTVMGNYMSSRMFYREPFRMLW